MDRIYVKSNINLYIRVLNLYIFSDIKLLKIKNKNNIDISIKSI